jgi:hypothetical protein
MTPERAIGVRAASAGEGEGGRQASRWTVRVPMVGRDPDGLQRHPSTLNWTRVVPVPEAVADEAVETNRPVTVGRARVVPEPIFRKEWLVRGGPPAHGTLMCERDDGACVFVQLPLM